jgi:hypothetical protein
MIKTHQSPCKQRKRERNKTQYDGKPRFNDIASRMFFQEDIQKKKKFNPEGDQLSLRKIS